MSEEKTKQEQLIEAFDLNLHMVRLLLEEPFFSVLSREIDKMKYNAIPTAGVKYNEKTMNFELLYNSDFMAHCSNKQKLGVLKHEFYHIMFEHLTARRPFILPKESEIEKLPKEEKEKLSQEAKMWNYATDLAINSHLNDDELPRKALKPGKDAFASYPPLKSAEWYFAELKKNPDLMNQGGGEGEQFDFHDFWDSLTNEQKEIVKEKVKTLVKKAVNEGAQQNRWGTLTNSAKEYVIEFVKDGFVPWEKELSYFVKKTQKAEKRNSQKKINRKYPYVHPGRKITRRSNVAIFVDQSGSVHDELLSELVSPLNALSKIASFTVIPFDAQVYPDKMFRWKKGQHAKLKRVCQGGTDFDVATDFFNLHKEYDAMIILTDLCAPKPGPCRTSRLWITTSAYADKPYFQTNEKIAVIKTKKSN